ncbi:hypothetical protein LY78DRAFT_448565 [Colletotrichum sublineola]|nr:hypothetical protein LY78DRAFT_448565 [Colletotrichum sublineola]
MNHRRTFRQALLHLNLAVPAHSLIRDSNGVTQPWYNATTLQGPSLRAALFENGQGTSSALMRLPLFDIAAQDTSRPKGAALSHHQPCARPSCPRSGLPLRFRRSPPLCQRVTVELRH